MELYKVLLSRSCAHLSGVEGLQEGTCHLVCLTLGLVELGYGPRSYHWEGGGRFVQSMKLRKKADTLSSATGNMVL